MKHILTIAAILLLAAGVTAQNLSYSAVVRNNANELVANQNITVAIAIANSENGAAVYSETHAVTTNRNGLVSLIIGEGTNQQGSMSAVVWPSALITFTYTLPDGATVASTVPMNAVPYALYADSVGRVSSEAVFGAVETMSDAQKAALRQALGIAEGGDDPATFTCGTSKMKDADNNEYETVQIGTQCWTKSNLRVAVGTNGTSTSGNATYSYTDSYYYVASGLDASVYGYYYNWPAAKVACPQGWHLPSDAEWRTMMEYLGSYQENGIYKYRCGDDDDAIGKALAVKVGWKTATISCGLGDSQEGNNLTGFSVVQADQYDVDEDAESPYVKLNGEYANFWTSTDEIEELANEQDRQNYARSRYLYSNYSSVYPANRSKKYGLSVRCVKND